jgi:hypothetical protein
MIHVALSEGPFSDAFRARAAELMARGWDLLKQDSDGFVLRSVFRDLLPELFRMVKQPLLDLFHGKCAYCESRLDVPDIENYRPR